jgi:hypothetical protein
VDFRWITNECSPTGQRLDVHPAILGYAARTFTLGCHSHLESRFVDLDATLGGKLSSEFERKPECIVKAKCIVTGHDFRVARSHLLELIHPLVESPLEATDLCLNSACYVGLTRLQFWVLVAEHRHRDRNASTQMRS